MKLLILRHAKAEKTADSGRDFDRALSPKGHRQCQAIAAAFDSGRLPEPHRILVSPAARALETARRVLDPPAAERIEIEDAIWEATAGDLSAVVDRARGDYRTLMLVGHNPGLEELVRWLTGEALPRGLKTGSVACLERDDGPPQPGEARILDVVYPDEAGIESR